VNLILSPGLLEAMVRHFQSEFPREGCGLLAGSEECATRFMPIANRLASATAFDMEPAELIPALRFMRESGERLLAIAHSHPNGPATLSRRDIESAFYPEAAHIVVSLASAENPVARGFRIVDGEVIEIELRVIV
jgi:proteasome lid subunit RPN8/RPN11